jgi:catechol 2,3-dioxygenase-like lactoylglutathione lyase family enzyme
LFLISIALALGAAAPALTGGDGPASRMPEAHFHHLHLNTLDPSAAIDFYVSKFNCEKAKFAGFQEAVWTQRSWLLFHKVKTAPPWELTSAIWHFGWGAEDMKAEYQKQLDRGTKFFTPLTPLSNDFFYAYVEGPDHALIELNTAAHHRFGHLHLFSEDPIAAGEWYCKYVGAKRAGRSTAPPSRAPRFYRGLQVGPSMSLMLDNVNIIIFPVQYSKQAYPEHWKGRTEMSPTNGRVVDHIGISYDHLAEALETLRAAGVKITSGIHSEAGGKVKYAFIEGPDHTRIELVEGHARKE